MNYKDLKELLDKREIDSMCRDEIFFDRGEGVEERKTLFFQYIKELQGWFDFYLYHKKQIMSKPPEDNEPMWEIMKTVNSHSRQKESEMN